MTVKIAKIFLALLFVAASTLWQARQAEAQVGIGMDATASHQFGEQITFVAQIQSPVQVQRASIFIQDNAQGSPIAFDVTGHAEYRLDVKQITLRPFAPVRWHYQLVLADGSTFRSEDFSIRYDDNRFNWQRLEAGSIRLYWYQGDATFGQGASNAAQVGLRTIGEIIPLDLAQSVDVFIYATQNDLPAGLSPGGEKWLAGYAEPALGVSVLIVEPGSSQNILMEQRIPHELMHVMLYRHLGAGYSNLPAWLREGFAMQAELYPNADYDRVLADAGARDGLIPLRDLCASFPPNSASAFLAYAEARSFITYLRGQYGLDGLLALANAYATGVDCERGPERAFGISLAKLERDWRVSVLGQNTFVSALQGMAPYMMLLCLVTLIPLVGILSAMRRKGERNEPETHAG
jgi:hypothetical protein